MLKHLTDSIIILACWIAFFYPLLLGTHLLSDHFLGTQAFYETLTRGSRRLLLQHVFEGWLYTLWIPVILAGLSLIKTPKTWPRTTSIPVKLLPGVLFLISIKFLFAISFLHFLPTFLSFFLIALTQGVFPRR